MKGTVLPFVLTGASALLWPAGLSPPFVCPLSVVAAGRASSGPASGAAPAGRTPKIAAGAAWELRLLGVDTPRKLQELRTLSARRPVMLADVGTGGVSRSVLAAKSARSVPVEYRLGPNFPNCDPKGNTHDTQMIRCITDITRALGITVRILVYQPTDDSRQIAEAFHKAGREAAIICFFQSYWGDNRPILKALRGAGKAMIISPYAETGPPTIRTPQGHAHRPWGNGIDHFVTVAPLARKSDGSLCSVSDRNKEDTEIINFVAPSYYASGPGGTCPSALVATAFACYIYAASPTRPTPKQMIALMRGTSDIDEARIMSTRPFSRATAETFRKAVRRYTQPNAGKRRKLDAPGLLNLYKAFRRIRGGWPGPVDRIGDQGAGGSGRLNSG